MASVEKSFRRKGRAYEDATLTQITDWPLRSAQGLAKKYRPVGSCSGRAAPCWGLACALRLKIGEMRMYLSPEISHAQTRSHCDPCGLGFPDT
jgi:hypothetical protein